MPEFPANCDSVPQQFRSMGVSSHRVSFTGPTKGELCRQLGVVILVDDQLKNILDAVSHGLFDDLSWDTILVDCRDVHVEAC